MDQMIESHARDDITLAPVGSHLSFAAAARFASTPFNPNNSGGARPGKGLDVSDISMTNDDEREAEPVQAEPVIIDKPPNLQDQTAPNATQDDGNSFRKNLRYTPCKPKHEILVLVIWASSQENCLRGFRQGKTKTVSSARETS